MIVTTSEQTQKFRTLKLDIVDLAYGVVETLDNVTRPQSAGILSERRIARALMKYGIVHPRSAGGITGEAADWVFRTMKKWKISGYAEGEFFERRFTRPDYGVSFVLYVA